MNNSSPKWFTRTDCRICSGPTSEILPFGDVSFATCNNHKSLRDLSYSDWSAPLTLRYCYRCHFAQTAEVVCPSVLYGSFQYQSSFTSGLRAHFDEVAQRIKELGLQGSLVEVGSNRGDFLLSCKSKGIKCVGIEPSQELALASQELGTDTICGFFGNEDVQTELSKLENIGCIYVANTLANIDDIHSFFSAASSLISSNGFLVIDTQDLDAVIHSGLVDTVYHEHLSYFSVKSFQLLLDQYGFRFIEVIRNRHKGGSFTLYLQRSNYSNDELPEDILLSNDISALPLFVEGLKRRIASVTLQDRSIVGFGSSVGCSTMFNWLGLSQVCNLIYDDNPTSDGVLCRDSFVRVESTLRSSIVANSVVLMLAHRYADAIASRHSRSDLIFTNPWVTSE